jgi:hypothetical protein
MTAIQMRRVIDSNYLRTPALREYLAASANNQAVIADHTAMEAYKDETLSSLFKSMEILADFPRQVVVLKGTRTLCGLHGKGRGLQKRMIDQAQSKGFPVYCAQLRRAQRGDQKFITELVRLAKAAAADMSNLAASVPGILGSAPEVAAAYSPSELRVIRTRAPWTRALHEKFAKQTMFLAAFMFRDHPLVKELPPVDQVRNTYIFRLAVCAQIWILDDIAHGVRPRRNHERVLNDLIDLQLITCATYFDALMSADQKALRIYRTADFYVREAFA